MIMVLFVFLIGTALGAFLSIWAEKGKLRHVRRRMVCKNCTKPLKGHHMLPVLGWLMLRGRCGHCKKHLPVYYVVLETVFGLLLAAIWVKFFGWEAALAEATGVVWLLFARDVVFALLLGLVVLFMAHHRRVPTWLMVLTIPAVFLVNIGIGFSPIMLLVVGAGLGVFLWMQYLVMRGRWVDWADIWVAILVGIMLGSFGVVALMGAYLFAVMVGILVLLSGQAQKHEPFSLGWFLSIAAILVLVFEPMVSRWLV